MKLFCFRVIHFGIYVKYFTCLLKQRAIRIIESKMAAPTVEQIIAQPLPVRVYVYKTHVYHSLAPHPSPPPRFCHTRLQNSFLLVTLARIQLFFLGQNEFGDKVHRHAKAIYSSQRASVVYTTHPIYCSTPASRLHYRSQCFACVRVCNANDKLWFFLF